MNSTTNSTNSVKKKKENKIMVTRRIDSELLEKVNRLLLQLRPKETFTNFLEKALWERYQRENENLTKEACMRKERLPDEALLCPSYYLKKLDDQREKSMLGQRTRFLKLHRFIDSLSYEELKAALEKVKKRVAEENKGFPGDRFVDTSILLDVLHHEIAIREEYTPDFLLDIAKDYFYNVNLSILYPEIDSDHLIDILSD